MGIIIGAIIFLAAIALFIFYGLPMLRDMRAPEGGTDINVEVPDEIDVNVSPPPSQ